MDLESVWAQREESVYPDLFGPNSRGIFTLSQETFKFFPNAQIDPRWLHHGVFEYAPHDKRTSWVYVTSGYSNPWDIAPQDYAASQISGAGVEFTIEVHDPGDWAIRFLLRMLAFDMLLATGQLGDKPALQLHDRVPLRSPIDGKTGTPVTSVILCRPENYPEAFDLPSGKVEILQFVGVTDAEREQANTDGVAAAFESLRAKGGFPITSLERSGP